MAQPASKYLRALFTLINNKEEFTAWHALISLGTLSQIFHVELLFPFGQALTADPAGGVHWVKRDYNRFHWVELPLPWITKTQIDRIKKAADKIVNMGAGYDLLGAFFGQFISGAMSDDKFFCSELAVHLLAPYTPSLNVTKWYSPSMLWTELYKIVKTKYPAFIRLT